MNRNLLIGIGGVVVIALIAGGIMLTRGKSDDKTNTPAETAGSTSYKMIDACSIYSLSNAKTVLGDSAALSANSGNADTENEDLKVSQCSYNDQAETGMTATGILVRSPKSDLGITSNKDAFTTDKPAGVEDVSGYGDAAYWNQSTGQFNVLKGNTWVIFTYMKGIKPSATTLEELTKFADVVIPNM